MASTAKRLGAYAPDNSGLWLPGSWINSTPPKRLEDLRIPPGNRLEALVGDRKGQHSIRINERYRVCFRWSETGPAEVGIVDYH